MLLTIGSLTFGGKPLRLLATSVCSVLALLLLRDVRSSIPAIPPVIQVGGRISKAFSFNTFYHQYESPKDVIIPQAQGRELATESRIGKVSMLQHTDSTYLRALQTHEGHNRRFGYPMFLLRHSILENDWSKPSYILAVMLDEMRKPEGHRLKWLLWAHRIALVHTVLTRYSWSDVASVVMNPKISLDVFLPPAEYPHIHLLASDDDHGLNIGVFFIEVHPWSIDLLSAIIAFPAYRPDIQLNNYDKSALSELLKESRFQENYVLLPQSWFNSYQAELDDNDPNHPWHINLGDFLVHFPAGHHQDERLRMYLDRAERHLPECEVDFENTSYPGEIQQFWAYQHDNLVREKEAPIVDTAEAEDLLRTTERQLEEYRDGIDGEDFQKVEEGMDGLKQSLEAHADSEALLISSNKLREVCYPFSVQRSNTD